MRLVDILSRHRTCLAHVFQALYHLYVGVLNFHPRHIFGVVAVYVRDNGSEGWSMLHPGPRVRHIRPWIEPIIRLSTYKAELADVPITMVG